MYTINLTPYFFEGGGVLQLIHDSRFRCLDSREASLLLCVWLICKVREGNWLTQWQKSHLSHHWQQTALSSSNFLHRYQIAPVIASSQSGSNLFQDSVSPPHHQPSTSVHTVSISLKGVLKVVTNLGLLSEINRASKPSAQSLINWGDVIEMFMSDYGPRRLEYNTLMCDKICKHSKPLDIGGDL